MSREDTVLRLGGGCRQTQGVDCWREGRRKGVRQESQEEEEGMDEGGQGSRPRRPALCRPGGRPKLPGERRGRSPGKAARWPHSMRATRQSVPMSATVASPGRGRRRLPQDPGLQRGCAGPNERSQSPQRLPAGRTKPALSGLRLAGRPWKLQAFGSCPITQFHTHRNDVMDADMSPVASTRGLESCPRAGHTQSPSQELSCPH